MDYYQLLGVDSDVTTKQIKRAYHSIIKKLSENVLNSEKIVALDMMKKMHEAYIVLSDDESRKRYDVLGKDIPTGQSDMVKYYNLSSYIFQVEVNYQTGFIKMPHYCACCMSEKIDDRYSTKHEKQRFLSIHSLSLKFPLCHECQKHIDKSKRMFYLIPFISAFIAGICRYIMKVMLDESLKYTLSGILAFIIAIGLFFLIGKCVKFNSMSLDHTCYDSPVIMETHNKTTACFSFKNWSFAKQFAATNNSNYKKIFFKRYSNYRSFLLGHSRTYLAFFAMMGWTLLALVLSSV